jgi:hypothetical protein
MNSPELLDTPIRIDGGCGEYIPVRTSNKSGVCAFAVVGNVRGTQQGRDGLRSHASLVYVGIAGRMHRSCESQLRNQFIYGNYAHEYHLFDSYGRG